MSTWLNLKMVYISNPTELGTVYSLDELELISKYCKESNLLLYVDGARLGSALTLKSDQTTMSDLCRLTDAFFIGATKMAPFSARLLSF